MPIRIGIRDPCHPGPDLGPLASFSVNNLLALLASVGSLSAATLETTVTADTCIRNDTGPNQNWNSDSDGGGGDIYTGVTNILANTLLTEVRLKV
jgi:hypothetical protein